MHLIEIEAGLAAWLMGNPVGLSRRRTEAKRHIRDMVGNAVFSTNIPPNGHKYAHSECELAITIGTQAVDRNYVLSTDFQDDEDGNGEDRFAAAIINVVAFARGGSRPEVYAKRLAGYIREATVQYQGVWPYSADDGSTVPATIDAATILSEGDLPPTAGVSTASRWSARYQQRWKVTYDQTPIYGLTPQPGGDPLPPPPPLGGIGHDVIGSTPVT